MDLPGRELVPSGVVVVRLVLRGCPEDGAGPVPAGPFCPWKHLQPLFESTTVVARWLLRNQTVSCFHVQHGRVLVGA